MVAPKVHLLFILLPAYLEILVALRSKMLNPNNIKHYPSQTKPCGGYELSEKMPHRELMFNLVTKLTNMYFKSLIKASFNKNGCPVQETSVAYDF